MILGRCLFAALLLWSTTTIAAQLQPSNPSGVRVTVDGVQQPGGTFVVVNLDGSTLSALTVGNVVTLGISNLDASDVTNSCSILNACGPISGAWNYSTAPVLQAGLAMFGAAANGITWTDNATAAGTLFNDSAGKAELIHQSGLTTTDRITAKTLTTSASTSLGVGPAVTSNVTGATFTTANVIPAGCILQGISWIVTTTLAGPTSFKIETSGNECLSAAKCVFGTGLSPTAGASGDNTAGGYTYGSPAAGGTISFAAAKTLLLTPTGGSFTSGVIEIVPHCVFLGKPSS